MSEKNNIFENDLLMRAILEGGQEEVPGHIWDAVSESLDRSASDMRRKTVTIWWRRAGVSVAAAAAAVAAVLVLSRPQESDFVPAAVHGDMVAVVEQEAVEADQVRGNTSQMVAYVPQKAVETAPVSEAAEDRAGMVEQSEVSEGQTEMAVERQGGADEVAGMTETSVRTAPRKQAAVNAAQQQETFPAQWEDEQEEPRRIRTSLTVSGITGGAGQNGNNGMGPHKAPSLILPPTETGIRDKGMKSSFGLPVSVGAGVKFEFTPRWSLGVGLNYTYLSRTFDGTYTHVNEAGIIDNAVTSDIRNSQHYIGIPVNAYFNIVNSKHVNFYAYAGGTVEKCLMDKYLVLSDSIVHREKVKGVQASANVGIGAEFMLGEHIGLYLDPSLRYYFDCGQPKSIRTMQPLMLGLELGLRFRL